MIRLTLSPGEVQALYDKLENIEALVKQQKLQLEDPILGTEGVMNLLNVSRRSLQNWRDNGMIEYSAVNGKFYYRISAIDKMLSFHLQKTEG